MVDPIRKTLDKDLLKQEMMSAVVGTLAVKSDMRAKFMKNPSEYLKNNGINPNSVNIEILCKAVFDLDKKLSKTMATRIENAFPKFPTAFVKFTIIVPKISPVPLPDARIKPLIPRKIKIRIKPIVPDIKPIVPKPIIPSIKPYMPCLDVKIDIERIRVLEDLKPLITKAVLDKIVKIKK